MDGHGALRIQDASRRQRRDRGGQPILRLPTLVELKLASGMTNPGRLKDLADVQEVIRSLGLKADFASQLHPYVRGKYQELLAAVDADRE